MSGTLYLVGTPIGNLEDISYRCIRILQEVDMIAAEDTRQTQKLLQFYNIKNKLSSYHEHNKIEKQDFFLHLLREGKNIALVTDAGMPAISDPGEDLVRCCIKEGIAITTIPGPTAMVSGLVLSGMALNEFLFLGFLPADKKDKNAKLSELENLPYTFAFYEAPHRLRKTLEQMGAVFGGERKIALARELTKKFEEVLHFTLEEAVAYYEQKEPKGEYVLILEGKSRTVMKEEARKEWEKMPLEEHLEFCLKEGLSEKEAYKQMAKDRGVSKRDIYQFFHKK